MAETRDIPARLRGVFAPVVTPFDARSGELDRPGFERNLRAHISAGLHGVVVAGSTGEAPLLDESERAVLVASARAAVPRDRLVIAGAGAESTRTALRLARQAAGEGADAVIVVAPHYYGEDITAAALATHYRRIADESPIPVVLYNIPKYMHFALPPGVVAELAEHDNVVGIKDSSGDLELLAAYLAAQSAGFRVLTGSGTSFAPALARGVVGGILAVSTFAPALALEVYEASLRGDADSAASAQERLGPLASQIVGGLGVPGVKAALDHVGLVGGAPRPPLLPLRGAERERVATVLRVVERPVPA
ncbi:MAG: dihydrodipicolinate synthase family protein [Gemmatimonadota bacterium]|nr:dihydrodipicolinate synthase family protein [Gemmatimonadota bacterium]